MTTASTLSRPDCCTDALRRNHIGLRDRLTALAEDVLVELPCGSRAQAAREDLVAFVRREIIPRAEAEEEIARAEGDGVQALVRALPGHHRMLEVLADEIEAGRAAITVAAAVGGLVLLCDARWDGEDRALMPALAAAGVDLHRLVATAPDGQAAAQG